MYDAPAAPAPAPPAVVQLTGSVRIGRDVGNDLVLPDLLVSRHHARIDATQYGFHVVDLGSSNKTFVNGVPIARPTPLPDGAMLTVGRTRFIQNQGWLREIREERADELAVEHLSYTLPDGKTLTNNVSLRVAGPNLVAVLGPSGAGKSTLLRLIAGEHEPTAGQVRYQNVDVHTHYAEAKSRIGMVPQHTVAHSRLTARHALRYAAQLRLSGDISDVERERRVDQVLGELGLHAHADTRVDRLSGGQQRRLAIGFELLTRTSLLLLDEPTSGLDPALAYEVMRLLRRLADEGRQVLVTTHDTAHLDMCDTVVAMANGGALAYVGPPGRIADQFGTAKWPEIFTRLAAAPAAPPQPPPPGGKRPRRPAVPPPPRAPGRQSGSTVGRQFGVLVRRQLRLMFSDARYAAFLGLMPIALAVLALIVTDRDGLGPGQGPVPPGLEVTPNPAAMRLVLVLIVGALFTGMASSVRELVSERPIYQYERAAGLTAEAYLLSKLLIFGTVAVIQSVLLVGVVRLFRPGPYEATLLGFGTLEIILAVAATAVVSAVLGLLVSSLMTTVEQTMPPLVVAVMAQLVLSGGLGVEVSGRPVLEQISWLAPARWGYASAAGTIDLKALNPNGPDDPLWSHHPAVLLGAMAVLGVMAVGFALLTLRFVRRR